MKNKQIYWLLGIGCMMHAIIYMIPTLFLLMGVCYILSINAKD